MISVAVSLRDPFKGTLRGDTLRGEGRWERQCLEAVLQCPEIDRVYTANKDTCGPHAEPFRKYGHKFHDGIPDSEYKNTILVAMDFWQPAIHKDKRYRGMVFNIFHGLWEHAMPEVNKYKIDYGSKIAFTYGFPGSTTGPYLEGVLGKDFVEPLPVPACPAVTIGNNFDKKVILWNQRNIFWHMKDKAIEHIFFWIRDRLLEDTEKTFVILTAFRDEDLQWHEFKPNCADQFWSYESAQILAPVKDRVTVHGSISWQEVIDYNAQAKIVVGFPAPYGGAQPEAAMFGIPSVGRPETGTLIKAQNYLGFPNSIEEYVGILDRFNTDKDYYCMIGSSHRDFVAKNYTYKAFTDNLLNIFRKRGMV